MLEGAFHEGDLAPVAIPSFLSLPESQIVRIAAQIVPWSTTDFAKADQSHSSQSVGAVAWQAVPHRWEPSDGSISVSLANLERVGTTSGPQAIEDASSESDRKQRRLRPHESADQVSSESRLLLEQWRTMAERGDTDAQFNLGCAYLVGWGVGRDATAAASWFEAAADGDDARAQFNLGVIHAARVGVQRDMQRAFKWFKAAADQGDLEAQFNLGSMYTNGEGVEVDIDEAIRWYRRAAVKGHPEAQFNLAVIFTPELGERPNVGEAIRSYEQAFANDIVEAAFNIAVIYRRGVEVQRDFEKAVTWYTRAAEKGSAIAQYHLAMCFTNGTGTSVDRKAAFNWFSAAAEQGDVISQYNLAISYDGGLGVDKDVRKAVHWYQKAASQGLQKAQYILGARFAVGNGVEKSEVNAFVWIRYAAEQGHPASQCLLASMYYYGQGVFQDYAEAYKWVTLGLKENNPHIETSVQLRDQIVRELHHGQLKRSERNVTDWSPRSWDELKPSGYSIKLSGNNGESTYRIIGPIKFVKKLLKMWGIDQHSAVPLLGFDKKNKSYVDKLLQGDEYLVEGSETEDRIAYLFYIWSVLSEWFRDISVEVEWLTTAEQELNGKAPMDLILSGSITDLLLVKEFVDFASGRLGAC